MRAVVQRVTQSAVHVDGELTGQIADGLMVLIGVADNDEDADAKYLAEKVVGLRIFEDSDGKMNRSLGDVGGELLAVSQFTLMGDCRKGRRPSFVAAAGPEAGERLYELFIRCVESLGVKVARGRFRANMQVSLVNDGPVTLMLDSKKLF